jgi:hypothetical protein
MLRLPCGPSCVRRRSSAQPLQHLPCALLLSFALLVSCCARRCSSIRPHATSPGPTTPSARASANRSFRPTPAPCASHAASPKCSNLRYCSYSSSSCIRCCKMQQPLPVAQSRKHCIPTALLPTPLGPTRPHSLSLFSTPPSSAQLAGQQLLHLDNERPSSSPADDLRPDDSRPPTPPAWAAAIRTTLC